MLHVLNILVYKFLKWNEQINNICRKVCTSLAVMRRAKPFVPKSSLITIYNTMVLPHFDYAIIIWSSCSETNINRLQNLQNMAMRIILCVPFRTHINDMLHNLGFMSIRDRIIYVTGCMMFKVTNDMTPAYLNDLFQPVSNVHSVNTRGSVNGHFYIPKCNTNYGQSCFKYKGSVLWNVFSKRYPSTQLVNAIQKETQRRSEIVIQLCRCSVILINIKFYFYFNNMFKI